MTKVHTTDSRKLGFHIHATVFAATLVGLLAIDLAVGGKFWTHWVVIGWTPGLLAHWVFGSGRRQPALPR